MARRSRTAVLKRQRERKKMEKAELKRLTKNDRQETVSEGQTVASMDDLAALGLADPEEETEEEEDDA